MGLRDRIKKERKSNLHADTEIKGKVKGKKIVAETKKDFLETVNQLKSEFAGVMALSGEIGGDICIACLLINEGNVIGATFRYLGTEFMGDDAILTIKKKLRGSEGGMDLFQFEEGDMETAVKQNREMLIEKPVSLNEMGMKIKYLMDKWVNEKKGSGARVIPKIPETREGEKTFNLLELAKTQEMEKTRHRKTLMDNLMEADTGELERLKKRGRMGLDSGQKIGKITVKDTGEKMSKRKVVGGKKVKTPIDRLLELVKNKRIVKIDDALARKIGVKRTQIEEWAIILEDHNLVELHYPPIGGPEIRSVEK